MKKIVAFVLCISLAFVLSSCTLTSKSKVKNISEKTASTTEATTLSPYVTNPLTGISDLPSAASGKRPVAIMINNINSGGKNNAQAVQAGIGKADIVYETLAEGGITRYMALFQDYTNAPTIGTIRSARYTYAELALSHDAIYMHFGSDEVYTAPFIKSNQMDDIDLMVRSKAYFRDYDNGMASEHTVYTKGSLIANTIGTMKLRTDLKSSKNKPYFNFNPQDKPVTSAVLANDVTVKFSDSYSSGFSFDSETKMYNKSQRGNLQKDYVTGKTVKVKNIVVLYTPIKMRSDNYHVKADMSSGSGYYFSQGGYQVIKWSKNGSSNPLSLFSEDGLPLSINAGNTWVCIAPVELKADCSIK